jgi:hypothetical protein
MHLAVCRPKPGLTASVLACFLAFSSWSCGETPDVSGAWKGTARAIVDAEDTTIDVEMNITQTENDISGSVQWGPIEATVSFAEFSGPQLILVSEWADGSITLRGLANDNSFKGRFSIEHGADPEPFRGAFELSKE